MEEHLDANGVIQQTNEYQPLEDPRDPNSAKLTIHIDRVTGTFVFIPFEIPQLFLFI